VPRPERRQDADARLPEDRRQNAKYLEKQMLDIKSGARANGNSAAMKGVMPLVSDEQIKVLADYISKLKP
jgi:cytochrome c